MLITNLISVSKRFFLITFFSLISGLSFSQTAVRPTSNKVEEPTNRSKEPQEIDKKALREKEKAAFPVFVKTGNPERDNENYKKAKEAWIQANPEEYKKLNSSNAVIVVSKEKFEQLPIDRQNEITGHPEKYIIK
jgi:hypothetical protein